MRSKYVLNKNNKNTNPEIKIQKLKISKSQFSQTQQNYQILKPRSTKLIQKYNTTNNNYDWNPHNIGQIMIERLLSSRLNQMLRPLPKRSPKPFEFTIQFYRFNSILKQIPFIYTNFLAQTHLISWLNTPNKTRISKVKKKSSKYKEIIKAQ